MKKEDYKQVNGTKNDRMDFIVILMTIILLFCVSNNISFFGISQPKFLGIFFTISLTFLIIRNKFRLKELKVKSFSNCLYLGLSIFSFVTALSIIVNGKLQATNVFEIIRPIIYVISFMVFAYIFNTKGNIITFNKLFLCLVVLLFVINLIQFYNVYNVNDLYIKVIAPTQYSTLIDNYQWPRIVGLISNPNVYGYLLSLFNVYLIYIFFNEKSNKKKFVFALIILIIKISLFLTGSRSAYVCMIFSEFFFVFFYNILIDDSTKRNAVFEKIKKVIIPCLLLLLVELSLLFVLPLKYSWRIREIFFGDVRTFEMRKETGNIIIDEHLNLDKEVPKSELENKNDDLENKEIVDSDSSKSKTEDYYSVSDREKIREAINPEGTRNNSVIKKIIIGVGPIKTGIIIECEWIKLFIFYGVLGIISFLLIFVLPLCNIKKLNKNFVIYYLTIVLSYFLYMIVAGAFFSYNLFISILLFISLGYYNEKERKNIVDGGGKNE